MRGANTYRYSFLVDLQAAIAASPPSQRPALEASSAAIGALQWPADVWLDTQGRVRRLQLAEDPRAHTTTTKPNLLFSQDGNFVALTNVELYDFASPVTIVPPPDSQVVRLP